MKRVNWSIGKEGTTGVKLEKPPFRVFFREFADGELVNSFDLSEEELARDIEGRDADDESLDELNAALRELRKHNG